MDGIEEVGALAGDLGAELEAAYQELERTGLVEQWKENVTRLLIRYHIAAEVLGSGSDSLTPEGKARAQRAVTIQLAFFEGFYLEVQTAEDFEPGWESRAKSYADAIKVPYWQGRTKLLPLPAMPAQGTQCLSNCLCFWDIQPIDEEQGDWDCYWVRGADDSCQTCIQRAADWAPLRVRGGMLE